MHTSGCRRLRYLQHFRLEFLAMCAGQISCALGCTQGHLLAAGGTETYPVWLQCCRQGFTLSDPNTR